MSWLEKSYCWSTPTTNVGFLLFNTLIIYCWVAAEQKVCILQEEFGLLNLEKQRLATGTTGCNKQ